MLVKKITSTQYHAFFVINEGYFLNITYQSGLKYSLKQCKAIIYLISFS